MASRDRARRASAAGRRTTVALVATALVTFAGVSVGALVVAHHIARDDALAEARRLAHSISVSVFEPRLPAVIAGQVGAVAELDHQVGVLARSGTLVRVKVWRHDGTIVYSDDHAIIGKRFRLSADVVRVIDKQDDFADISTLGNVENISERGRPFRQLVEVYTPLTLASGDRLAFEMYFSDTQVRQSEHELIGELVPFALLALLALALAQLPVSVWLVRHASKVQRAHNRSVQNALRTSERERRQIAQQLHDGVVQDLAAAGYALDGVLGASGEAIPQPALPALHTVRGVIRNATGALRGLLVELHPGDLTAADLERAISDSAQRICPEHERDVRVSLPQELPTPVVAFLYQCAREGLQNVAKHARARCVRVRITSDDSRVVLRVHDDGVGVPHDLAGRSDRNGHIGLMLLRSTAADLDGAVRVAPAGERGGTVLTVELPLSSAE